MLGGERRQALKGKNKRCSWKECRGDWESGGRHRHYAAKTNIKPKKPILGSAGGKRLKTTWTRVDGILGGKIHSSKKGAQKK